MSNHLITSKSPYAHHISTTIKLPQTTTYLGVSP